MIAGTNQTAATFPVITCIFPTALWLKFLPLPVLTEDVYAPTGDTPSSLLLILEGGKSFGELEKGMTLQQVCVAAGVEPEVFREYYRIAEEAGKQEPDCYILDYPFGDLLMNLKFPKWSEYELSEISFYNRKPDGLWENPEPSMEVNAKFVSYGDGYKSCCIFPCLYFGYPRLVFLRRLFRLIPAVAINLYFAGLLW